MLHPIAASLAILHGSIHVLGFVKSITPSGIPQLRQPIGRLHGVVWLSAAILFLFAGTMALFAFRWWWIPSALAIVLSQYEILRSWKDARFGTVANILLAMLTSIGCASWCFYERFAIDVQNRSVTYAQTPDSVLTEADIMGLPQPVQRYIRLSGAIGAPRIKSFNVSFQGSIRNAPGADWMDFSATQYTTLYPPDRLFFMEATMNGLPVSGYHRFIGGDASMDIRLLSLFPVEYQEGGEMDLAETVTFFNDLCVFAPGALVDRRIEWKETDADAVHAVFHGKAGSISAWLHFDSEGKLVNFVSHDRAAVQADHSLKKYAWSTPLSTYMIRDGHRLASYGEAVYAYPEGPFIYGRFGIEHVVYNSTPDVH